MAMCGQNIQVEETASAKVLKDSKGLCLRSEGSTGTKEEQPSVRSEHPGCERGTEADSQGFVRTCSEEYFELRNDVV